MEIIKRQVDKDFWDRMVNKCNYATFFHTRYWKDIVTKSFPFLKNVSIGLTFDDGRKALLPLLKLKAGPWGGFFRYISMWPGVYGGVVSDSAITSKEISMIFRTLNKKKRLAGGYWFGSPIGGQIMPKMKRNEWITTRMVDLRNGLEKIYMSLKKYIVYDKMFCLKRSS